MKKELIKEVFENIIGGEFYRYSRIDEFPIFYINKNNKSFDIYKDFFEILLIPITPVYYICIKVVKVHEIALREQKLKRILK